MTDEKLFDTVQKGSQSALVKVSIQSSVNRYVDQIIDRLVREYTDGSLTNDNLRGSIGEIAGLRRLIIDLESDVSRGITARGKIHGGRE